MYGDQQMMNTKTMVRVILTVLTLARGIIPLELALLAGAAPKPARSEKYFYRIIFLTLFFLSNL